MNFPRVKAAYTCNLSDSVSDAWFNLKNISRVHTTQLWRASPSLSSYLDYACFQNSAVKLPLNLILKIVLIFKISEPCSLPSTKGLSGLVSKGLILKIPCLLVVILIACKHKLYH